MPVIVTAPATVSEPPSVPLLSVTARLIVPVPVSVPPPVTVRTVVSLGRVPLTARVAPLTVIAPVPETVLYTVREPAPPMVNPPLEPLVKVSVPTPWLPETLIVGLVEMSTCAVSTPQGQKTVLWSPRWDR